MVSIALISNAQLPSYVPSNGLVGWWPLNGNVNDESGNGYHGTVKNGVSSPDRNGKSNGAYTFNSKEGSSLKLPFPTIENNFTISIWAKSNKQVQNSSPTKICYPSSHVGLANSNQNWLLKPLYGGSSGQSYGVGISFGTDRIIIGEHTKNILDSRMVSIANRTGFVHIVLVYTTARMILYVDGNRVSSKDMHCYGTPKILSKNFAEELYSSLFSGVIDDIGVWKRALTVTEVENLYKEKELNSKPEISSSEIKNSDGTYSEKKVIQVCSNQKNALNYFQLNKFLFEPTKITITGDIVDDFFDGEGLMKTVFNHSGNPAEVKKSGNGVIEKVYNGYYLFSHQHNPTQTIEGRVKMYYDEKTNEIIAVVFGVKGRCSYQVLFK